MVSNDLIDRIYDAAMAAGLVDTYRQGLLVGIDPAATALIPSNSVPALQLRHDLEWCNQRLANGSLPLRRWLENAARLTSSLEHGKAFRELLQQVGSASALAEKPWNIPAPTQTFKDRPDLIAKIDASLNGGRVTALTALHGLGGIGKTQLARKFAELRRDNYRLGAWIAAQSRASIITSLSDLAPEVGVAADQDQEATAKRVIKEIRTREPWLVVFDNAESAESVAEWIERLNTKGHVLVTSRSEHWDGVARPVSVTRWTEDEAADFLLQRTGQQDRDSAKALARELGGLVLAIEHAAAHMLTGDRMSFADYLRSWRSRLARKPPRGHQYPDAVATTLGLSMDDLRGDSEVAYGVLCLFSWLAPDRIPRKELLEGGAAKLPEVLAKAFADRDTWSAAMDALTGYSLIAREPDTGPVTAYSVHRVVQQVMRDRMVAEGSGDQWLGSACDLVDGALPSGTDPEQPQFWPMCDALLPHTHAVRAAVGKAAGPASFGRMLNQAGIYLSVRGLYDEARDFGELALESGLRQFGPDHPDVAVHRSNLAIILRDLGEHAEARRQIELALESDLRQFGPDHPNVAVHRGNLATVLYALGEFHDALREIDLALEVFRKKLPGGHPHISGATSRREVTLRALESAPPLQSSTSA